MLLSLLALVLLYYRCSLAALLVLLCLPSLARLHCRCSLAALLVLLFVCAHPCCLSDRLVVSRQAYVLSPNWTASMKLSEPDSIQLRFVLRVEAPGLARCENPGTHRHGSSCALHSRLPRDFTHIILQRLGTADSREIQCFLWQIVTCVVHAFLRSEEQHIRAGSLGR